MPIRPRKQEKSFSFNISLLTCRQLFEKHFEKNMPGKMTYQKAAQLVLNSIGKDEFLKRVENFQQN
ncbi:MAG TPA: hypothetical protein ENH82_14580 [bacterium]|nr:hypothetical protein [bacterium]